MSLRLLLVEDDPDQSDLWLPRLRAHGYDCWHVTSGRDAIQAAAALTLDVVLMDIGLEGLMTGIEAAVRLRIAKPHLAVIFLTAAGNFDTLEQAKLALPAGYVLKPFLFEDLIAAIEKGVGHVMPEISNDHDLLVRLDVKLDLVSVQLNEARVLVAAKADRETLEPRLVKIETALSSVTIKLAAIGGFLAAIQFVLKFIKLT